jgi:hypothetical protein
LATKRNLAAAGLVEVLEVDGRQSRQFLDPALSEPHPGLALDRIASVAVAAARALQRTQLAQPVRVAAYNRPHSGNGSSY